MARVLKVAAPSGPVEARYPVPLDKRSLRSVDPTSSRPGSPPRQRFDSLASTRFLGQGAPTRSAETRDLAQAPSPPVHQVDTAWSSSSSPPSSTRSLG